MIGSAKESGGLYILEENQPIGNKQTHASIRESDSVFNKIMLWHNRLGHPSFMYLKKFFPSLFMNKDLNSFHCDICQFAKHTRGLHPIHSYKSSKLFSLIHNDI